MTDIRSRVLGGETLFGAFCDLASPLAAELAGKAGYDWLILDLEHGASTEADLLGLLHAVATTPAAALVRPQSAERLRIGRALDLGASGVMLPQLQSAAEVRAAMSFLRYPPVGTRGLALRTRGADMGALSHADVARVVNERILGIVQIEARGTVTDADEIAAIDGVDVLFVGPADLSHNLGVPGRFDDRVYLDALETVAAACQRHGKAAGILLYDTAVLAQHLELGFRFVGLGSEGAFVGPADLSHNLGVPGRFDDRVYLDALETVVAACQRHGKAAGILLYDTAVLAQHLELGFRFVGLGSEGAFVSAGAAAMLKGAGRG